MAFTSLGVVLVSTLTFVLGTFPEFQSFAESGTPEEYPEAVAAMSMIDNVLVGFFVIEYVVSFFPFIPPSQCIEELTIFGKGAREITRLDITMQPLRLGLGLV